MGMHCRWLKWVVRKPYCTPVQSLGNAVALVDLGQIYSSPSGSPVHRPVSHPALQTFSFLKRIFDLHSAEQMLHVCRGGGVIFMSPVILRTLI